MSSKIGVISLVEGEVKTSVHSNAVGVGGAGAAAAGFPPGL